MAATDEKDIVTFEKFFGLRNNVRPEAFAIGDLEVAQNIDIDDELRIRMRRGFATALVAGSYQSLFPYSGGLVAVTGSTLQRIALDGTVVSLRSAVGATLSYAAAARRLYYTDGTLTGCIENGTNRTWGLEPPSSQPVATAEGGSLAAGTYQYAVTYVRSDGQVSGTGVAGSITLTATGGIKFSAIPVSGDPTVTRKYLYVSPVNGDMLFRQMTLPAAASVATYDTEVPGTKELDTQFLQPPIAGQVIAAGPGYIYVGRGRKLYRTKPYNMELMDLRQSYPCASQVLFIGPVDDGVWVGTATEIVFLAGVDPSKWDYNPKAAYGVVSGASAEGSAEDIDPALNGPAIYVGTAQGVVACLNGGIMKNLTKERFAYPTMDRGAAAVRSHGGMIQYLMVLEGTETAPSRAF